MRALLFSRFWLSFDGKPPLQAEPEWAGARILFLAGLMPNELRRKRRVAHLPEQSPKKGPFVLGILNCFDKILENRRTCENLVTKPHMSKHPIISRHLNGAGVALLMPSPSKKRAKMPDLTHLQFLVLRSLGIADMRGYDIRMCLQGMGCSKSKPAFYQLMSRLEESGYVDGRYDQKIIDGQIIKERVYSSTLTGGRAVKEVLDFYDEHLRSNIASEQDIRASS